MAEKTPDRLRGYLRHFAEKYPGAWKQFELFRTGRGKDLPDWPEWCWCPLSASYAIVSGGGDNWVPLDSVADVGTLGALAAWRMTQGIYRFDTDMFAALWDTPIAGKIPVDILYRLPEWCVYIEVPPSKGYQVDGLDVSGFFVHLEYDVSTGRPELRFIFDFGEQLLPFPVHLTAETLAECVTAAMRESERQITRGGLDINIPEETTAKAVDNMASAVSVVLYLCSVAADVADLRGKRERPANPAPTKTKKGLRTFPLDGPTTWLTGYRIGASLRLATGAAGRAGAGTGEIEERASPRPHIRRAHWHTYWTGPRDRPQKAVLKWLPPVPVGAGEIVPTIRGVG